MRTAVLATVLALLGLACRASPASPPGVPADAVTRFFAAVDAGDCTGAWTELGQTYRDSLTRDGVDCALLVDEMRKFPLESVVDTRTDGRNPDARLVHTRLRGRAQDVVIRVQADAGQWRIMAL
jgi:hypothetical protein